MAAVHGRDLGGDRNAMSHFPPGRVFPAFAARGSKASQKETHVSMTNRPCAARPVITSRTGRSDSRDYGKCSASRCACGGNCWNPEANLTPGWGRAYEPAPLYKGVPGRLAQRESTPFTREGSQVQSLHRPPSPRHFGRADFRCFRAPCRATFGNGCSSSRRSTGASATIDLQNTFSASCAASTAFLT